MNMTFTQADTIKVQQEQHKEAGSKKYNMQENMREAFLQSQRTQSLQYIKGKDRRKRKYRGTKKWKMNLCEKMSDEATARRTQLNRI